MFAEKSAGKKKGKKKVKKAEESRLPEKKNEINELVADRLDRPPKNVSMLTYKKLKVGMLFVGVVKKVNDGSLNISLPFGMVGTVNKSQVSDRFYEDMLDGGDKDEKKKSGLPGLSDIFVAGDLVQCMILALKEGQSSGRRVALSMRASLFNKGLTLDALGAGHAILGGVHSKEDHGYVISFGTRGFMGFLPTEDDDDDDEQEADAASKKKKKLKKGKAEKVQKKALKVSLLLGQPLLATIVSVDEHSKTVKLTMRSADVPSPEYAKMTVAGIKPGMFCKVIHPLGRPQRLIVCSTGDSHQMPREWCVCFFRWALQRHDPLRPVDRWGGARLG